MRSGGGTRTHNKRLNRPVLCRLSYPGNVDERSSAHGRSDALGD